ncbi:MAG TPA: HAMP domain-containing protein, partial [Candidatus Binatia bacterium]
MAKNMAADIDHDRLDAKQLLQMLSAVKKGDFSMRLPATWVGIDGKIADTMNEIVEMMSDSTKEIERVSRVVGRDGKLSQRVMSPAARGSWKSRVDAINDLIENLVRPTTEMARVIGAVAKGNLTQTVAVEAEGQPLRGEFLTTARMVNSMVKQLDAFAGEVTRVAREVGTDGKLGGQAVVPGVAGTWKDLTDNVNMMAGNLTAQVRSIADVTIAVANGDLSKKITVDVRGEILQLKEAINTMVDQLRSFAAEVTRVAREVGTDGKLGGQ